jgi:hypothetical protein
MRTTKTVGLPTKKPAASDAKARNSPSLAEETILSPILEDNKEEDFSTLPEVQGSTETRRLTGEAFMEPLSELQKDSHQLHRRYSTSPRKRESGRTKIL